LRTTRLVLIAFTALSTAHCTTVPSLNQATGAADSGILISDIVTRVKCEIADSFEPLNDDPRFLWLADWTVKADLTLQMNEQAGVSPSGSYTKFSRNAFNFDAGSTSLTSRTIGFVQQFFTLSAGANLGEQAVRTEVLSFSLALKELHNWRQQILRVESSPDFPSDRRVCNINLSHELTGDLGLQEWVYSAFYPVAAQDLFAGDHPPPNTPKATAPPSAVSPPKPLPAPAAGRQPDAYPPDELWTKDISAAHSSILDAAQQTKASASATIFANQQIVEALSSMRRLHRVYADVATEKILKTISEIIQTLELAAKYTQQDVAKANQQVKDLQMPVDTANKLYDNYMEHLHAKTDGPYHEDRDIVVAADTTVKTIAANAKLFADHAQLLQKNVALLSVSPDPPIDSILHSVQFVLSFGASVTPSWTFIRWKGPGLNSPAAAAQGVRTNILQLAFGPRAASGAKVSEEQYRLIQNATVLSTKPGP
jgi:hypothetical protein